MSLPEAPGPERNRLTELRISARGWQGVQLAVLGFIGLCGVLVDTQTSLPRWLQLLAGALALASLALACLGTYLVGRAAWPLYRAGRSSDDDPRELDRASRSLSAGLVLTFVAVALIALSAASGWWPSDDGAGAVEAQAQGRSFCGTLAEARSGAVRLETTSGPLDIPLSALSALRPVDGCD
jgi:predicted anti-sigma-YlaC factor YlaD